MKRYFFTALLFVFSLQSIAQNLYNFKGVVLDSADNEPLPGATVSLNFGEMAGSTDLDGRFSFLVPAQRIAVVIRYVGYVPKRFSIEGGPDMPERVIRLEKVSSQLEEVIIKTDRSDNLKRPLLGVSTLNIKTLEKIPTAMGEVDILRGLQMLPGVSSVGEASNGVNIRGGTTDQNLLLLDGGPIFNPTHMFGLFSAFPSEAVSNFDLYKGTVPSRYGGRAAAVLDVTLAQPDLNKFKLKGGVSMVSNRVKMDVPIIKDRLGVMVSGRAALNDWAFPIFAKSLQDIKAKFYDSSAKLFGKINDKNTVTATAYYSYDFFQTEALGTIQEINATSSQYRYSTLNFTGSWFTAFSDKLNLQTTLVSSQYDPSILLPEFQSENVVEIAQNIRYKQAKANMNYYAGKHTLEFVADATQYQLNPGELIPGTSPSVNPVETDLEYGLELGIGIEDQFEINDKVTLSAGIRYSDFRNTGPAKRPLFEEGTERNEINFVDTVSFAKNEIISQYGGFEPRIGLRVALSNKTSLKFGYNLLRQYLQVISNTTTPIPTSRWKTSDIYIKPQVSSLYTVGYFQDFGSQIYEFSAEAYYRHTDNIIDYKPGASFLLQSSPETELLQGINKSYGLELMIQKKKGELAGWINYTYSRSLNQVNEGPSFNQQVNFGNWYAANYDRPHTFNGTVVINQGDHHDFSFNFTYSSGRPFTTPQGFIRFAETNFPFYGIRNNDRIPDYHRLDFSWNIYRPSMKEKRFNGNWNFTVYNLYGRKNAYSVFFRKEDLVTKPYKLTVFGAPIVSLAYNFTFE
ncbi:TonB-dependent receptor [Jiulongibacter sediminis]|uniref:TonB-dependent receptor n=1 Tax=Jiulongibacter sediminis TaxID=1605367 RepID=A0A0P7BXS2_9BACT|nr:TonB-dependent receptor [Jiulongibacter sediminis]KPM49672.1 TonB-dependent receptor [Jiulongibacter sediminis]TBX26710.1 TonB-dependent receptor [Jiulongibacter sediminis]